jgi:hypothetical protein
MKIQFIKILFIGLAFNPLFANALEAPPFDYELQKKLLLEGELREKSALLDKSSSISCEEIKAQSIDKRIRSNQNLRCVFDANGGVLNNLFQRALVKNPTIEGKIVFDLIILPSGKVAPQTSLISSDLKNEKLESDLLNAVKNFDFLPVAESSDWHAKYPVIFLP